MMTAFPIDCDEFQAESLAWITATHHRVGSYGPFLNQKMQIGCLPFRKGLFRFEKHPARTDIADARDISPRNALPVDPNVAVCLSTRGESSARTYADQTFLPQGWRRLCLFINR